MTDVAVLDTTKASLEQSNGAWGSYWLSPSVGYIVLIDSSNNLEVWKTTDSGANWSEQDSANHKTAVGPVSAWFDQQTPGDSGTAIHIAWLTTGEFNYAAFSTSTDAWGSTVTIATPTIGNAGDTDITITKSVGGMLGAATRPSRFSDIDVFYTSTDGSTWTSRAAAYDSGTVRDRILLLPGNEADTDDLWAIYWDQMASELSLKVYDASGDSWSETSISTGISVGALGEVSSGFFDALIRHSDGHALVAAFNGQSSTADCQTWDINGAASITAKGDVVTNADDCFYVALMVNQQTDDVYAVYVGAEDGSELFQDASNVYYKKSTDGMASWGSQTAYSATGDDVRYVSTGSTVAADGGRFMPTWYNDDLDDLFVNDGNDIEIAVAGVEITVPVGTLTYTGQAPTVFTGPVIEVPAGSLTYTGFAPSVEIPFSVTVPVGSLSFTGFAPTPRTGIDIAVPAGALTYTGFAPIVVTAVGKVGVIYRKSDTSNYWHVYVDRTAKQVKLDKVVASARTNVASESIDLADGEFRVIVQGNRHRVWWNFELLIDEEDSALNTATKAGLAAEDGLSGEVTFDNWYAQGLSA